MTAPVRFDVFIPRRLFSVTPVGVGMLSAWREALLRLWDGLDPTRILLPHGIVGDSILGDAREEYADYMRKGGFAPRVWYTIHAMRLACGNVITRGRGGEVGIIIQEIKFGARSLMRMPGSAVIAVVVLAIGIGLSSFMFTIIYGIYFRGMDIPEVDRVFVVSETNVERDQTQNRVPIQDVADWRERQRSFEGLVAVTGGTVNLAGTDEPIRFQGAFTSANTFAVLGVSPMIGRGFVEGDDLPGSPLNVVLGFNAWRDDFGSDRSVLGRDVRVNGEPGTILGVMPEGFEFPNNTEVWIPLRDDPLATARRQGRFVTVYGRLKDGVSRDQAAQEMAGIARQLEQEYPEANEGIGVALYTPVEANTDDVLNMIFGAMMFAVICVLLVACANVASLLLARAAMRTKEAGIRVALGASRLRVMLPFFSEALVLAMVGAVLGIGITYVGVDWFDQVTDPARTGRPWFMQFQVDLPILGFVICITMFAALISGIAPALQMSRTDVSGVLKDQSRGSSSRDLGRLSRILVTAEVALSCALLVGAGLMTKSIVNVGDAEYPFETEGLFTARVGLFAADYPDQASRQQLWTDLIGELEAIPRVSDAALTSVLPYASVNMGPIGIDGAEYLDPADLPVVNRAAVTSGFFATLGTEVTGGRNFSEQDDEGSQRVAIVNQPMVDRYFDGQNPVGLRFREGASDTLPLLTIVGVAPDLHMQGAQPEGVPGFEPSGYYVPLKQDDQSFLSIAANTRDGNAMAITADVRSAVRRVDPNLPIYQVFSEAEVIDRAIWFYNVFGTVFIIFGISALFMASVGLYGVLSFAVSRRTQEMGIRMALGAGSRQVVQLVARQGAQQLSIGLGLGLALAFGVTRLISVLMYDVNPQDPVIFGGVFGLIIVVGMAAAVFPALRATSVNPVEALRSD